MQKVSILGKILTGLENTNRASGRLEILHIVSDGQDLSLVKISSQKLL